MKGIRSLNRKHINWAKYFFKSTFPYPNFLKKGNVRLKYLRLRVICSLLIFPQIGIEILKCFGPNFLTNFFLGLDRVILTNHYEIILFKLTTGMEQLATIL